MNAIAKRAAFLSSFLSHLTLAGCAVLTCGWLATVISAQQAYVHLNPIIARLAAGQPFYGLITNDFSLSRAQQAARHPAPLIRL